MPKIVHNALSPLKIKALTRAGRYADGNGLYLVVDDGGAKRWVLRTLVHGKRRDMGLGSLQLVSLPEARKRAAANRLIARDGGDPIAQRRQANRAVLTFKEATEAVHASHSKGWKNPKHRDQWINTLRDYTFEKIGGKRVNAVTTADVLQVLTPIWLEKPETARRVRQRMRAVLDWAKAAGHRDGDNPVDGVGKGLPKQTDEAEHHAALPYADLNPFLTALHASSANDVTKLALEFLILTAMRTGEVIGATWSEIDTKAKTWTIPKERMKAQREHRVPLSERCMAILKHARKLSGDGYIFPGVDHDTPLSNMAFLMALRRMGYEVTAHGFRSAFRDWAAERTTFPREVCEAALAHSNADKVEAAYLRSDLFEQRRALMGQWATHAAARQARQGAAHGKGCRMSDERDYDVNRPLRDVIGTLLELVLPAEQRDLIPRLTDMVSACKGIVEHRGKLWGELSEGECNIVATRVGAIAREILGTGRAADTGETLAWNGIETNDNRESR